MSCLPSWSDTTTLSPGSLKFQGLSASVPLPSLRHTARLPPQRQPLNWTCLIRMMPQERCSSSASCHSPQRARHGQGQFSLDSVSWSKVGMLHSAARQSSSWAPREGGLIWRAHRCPTPCWRVLLARCSCPEPTPVAPSCTQHSLMSSANTTICKW